MREDGPRLVVGERRAEARLVVALCFLNQIQILKSLRIKGFGKPEERDGSVDRGRKGAVKGN